eukprot:CAMPEP_0115239318 /NCGR_PEP_ID=MMETSP0270-20121206/37336_1 /TAXON_ID=71861 /ORGANISM="Scrippsiella trochoidea, Strain CCMP3099" /LENGTH=138 /DNA_ID=CAMNT_0002654271 /DNA_START=292 /DNA_END=704 /DNA_ORIENTATION=+
MDHDDRLLRCLGARGVAREHWLERVWRRKRHRICLRLAAVRWAEEVAEPRALRILHAAARHVERAALLVGAGSTSSAARVLQRGLGVPSLQQHMLLPMTSTSHGLCCERSGGASGSNQHEYRQHRSRSHSGTAILGCR